MKTARALPPPKARRETGVLPDARKPVERRASFRTPYGGGGPGWGSRRTEIDDKSQAGFSSDSWETRRGAAASSRARHGRRKTPVFRRAMAGRSKEQGAPGVPLDGFAPLAMTAMLQPPLGGHTVWETRSEINPESFNRASRGFKRRSIAFRKFQPFSQNPELSMAYGRAAAKKIADRAVGRTWVARAAKADGPTPRVCPPGQLRIPLARLVLVHPDSRLPPPDLP
jgi:hypothetical protein